MKCSKCGFQSDEPEAFTCDHCVSCVDAALTQIEKLLALIQQWRDEAEIVGHKAMQGRPFTIASNAHAWKQNGIENTYRRCADDLERILKEES